MGVDIMSRYIWRGSDYGASPSIQPYIELSLANFNLGVWAAYTTNLPNVQELDLYASYTIYDLVTFTITDYSFPDEISGYDYFDYVSDSSVHIIEGLMVFNGTEKFPVSMKAGINFYNDSDNSLYLETGYSFSCMNIFIGAGNGMYTSNGKFNFVNIGIGITKEISVTEKYSIPLSASFITNPEAGKVFLVFGISF